MATLASALSGKVRKWAIAADLSHAADHELHRRSGVDFERLPLGQAVDPCDLDASLALVAGLADRLGDVPGTPAPIAAVVAEIAEGPRRQKPRTRRRRDCRLMRKVVPQVPQPLGCPRLAEALLDRAAEGDLTALREVCDRLDGRPAQAITTEATTPPGMISIKDA